MIELFKLKVLPSSPTRSTLAVYCCSQVSISVDAAQAFEDLVSSKSGIGINKHRKWRQNLGYAPPIAEFTKYWEDILGKSGMKDKEAKRRLLGEIPYLVQKHPQPNSGDKEFAATPKGEGVNYIKDAKKFKKNLKPSEAPKPSEHLDNRPVQSK